MRRRQNAAARTHQQKLAVEAALGENVTNRRDVSADLRPRIGVGSGGGRSFVLVPFTRQLGAGRDIATRQHFAQPFRDLPLILRLEIRIDKGDSDGFDVALFQQVRSLLNFFAVRRLENFARARDTFGDLKPQLARHQNRIALVKEIEQSGAIAAGEFEDVPEAFGRDQSHGRTGALQQRINDKRRAVLEQRCVLERHLRLLEAIDDAIDRIVMRRQAFSVANLTVAGIKADQVGESAAGVDGYIHCHFQRFLAGCFLPLMEKLA